MAPERDGTHAHPLGQGVLELQASAQVPLLSMVRPATQVEVQVLFTQDAVVLARSGQQAPWQKTLPDGQETQVPSTQP